MRVEMIAPDVGGGFGQKCHLFPEEIVLPLLSKELGRPVKWIEDRIENLMTGTHAKQQLNEMEIAFDESGKIVGLRQHVIGDGGAYNCFPWTALVEPMAAAGTVTSVYDITDIKTRFEAVLTNKVSDRRVPRHRLAGAADRAREPARPGGARSSACRRSSFGSGTSSSRSSSHTRRRPGSVTPEGSYLESIEALEGAIDYEEFRPGQKRERERGRYLGLGISVFNEVTGSAPSPPTRPASPSRATTRRPCGWSRRERSPSSRR